MKNIMVSIKVDFGRFFFWGGPVCGCTPNATVEGKGTTSAPETQVRVDPGMYPTSPKKLSFTFWGLGFRVWGLGFWGQNPSKST